MREALNFQYLIGLRKCSFYSADHTGLAQSDVLSINLRILGIDKPRVIIEMMGLSFIPVLHRGERHIAAWCPKARHVAFFVPPWMQDIFETFAARQESSKKESA